MPICQIATVGFKADWIQKGLFKYSTDLLILVTTKEFRDSVEDVKEMNKEIPIELKIVERPRDSIYLIEYFSNLILDTANRGFDVIINVTSGLTSWQLSFYLVATVLEEYVKTFYIFDKELTDPVELLLYKPLSETEKKILNIITKEGSSLDSIVERYRNQHEREKGSKGLISRYLNELSHKGLIQSERQKRIKRYKLTTKGKKYALLLKASREEK